MIPEPTGPSEEIVGLYLRNNTAYLDGIRASRKGRLLFLLSPRLRKLYAAYLRETLPDPKNRACAKVLDAFEQTLLCKARYMRDCLREDLRVFRGQYGRRQETDRSPKGARDYYSVAVIVKNEARYIREYILFNRAAGADRIYLYDNDSTDGLREAIEPFVEEGFVVYRKWPGHTVQTAAYRHAVRNARRRTKWLALIDADEFLFSPRGKMPEILKAYEDYPGVAANWLLYGPCGHKKRPAGLVMDNYTERVADSRSFMNCHVKSIVQPAKVLCVHHAHYARYRGKGLAVDECREPLGHTYAVLPGTGMAFTGINHRNVFRINHYITKSYEDLEAKCARGYADGSPNADFDRQLLPFAEPQVRDDAIRPYAEEVAASGLL